MEKEKYGKYLEKRKKTIEENLDTNEEFERKEKQNTIEDIKKVLFKDLSVGKKENLIYCKVAQLKAIDKSRDFKRQQLLTQLREIKRVENFFETEEV